MSLFNKVKSAIELAQLAETGYELIRDIIKHYKSKDDKIDVLGMIEKVVDGIFDAIGDKRTVDEIKAEIAKLRADLVLEDKAADAAGDAALDAKFPR